MGHAVGDRMLQQVAEVLRKGLSSSDEVCRW
jgi:PleD family two-component response regulator